MYLTLYGRSGVKMVVLTVGGVGFYFRNVTELILFGVRGSMRTLAPARSQVNMLETRKREHSRKPDEQYDLIEQCSPGAVFRVICPTLPRRVGFLGVTNQLVILHLVVKSIKDTREGLFSCLQ